MWPTMPLSSLAVWPLTPSWQAVRERFQSQGAIVKVG